MGVNLKKNKVATKVAKKKVASKKPGEEKIKALLAELKPLEAEVEFDYPEAPTVANLTALLKDVKASAEADDEDDDAEEEDDSKENEEEAGSDDEEEADAEDDDDYDGDPELERPKNLSREDTAQLNQEIVEIKGKSVEIVDETEHIRTYSEDLHGDDFKVMAEGFVEKRNEMHKVNGVKRKCILFNSKDLKKVFVKYRRETGKGDNRRIEMQKVEFSAKGNGPKFKELAHALAVKVGNTPGQDGPGVVVVK